MAQHPLERSQHRRLEGRYYGFTHWSDGCGASSVCAARRYTLEQEMAAGFCLDDVDCVDVHLLQELVPQRMGQLQEIRTQLEVGDTLSIFIRLSSIADFGERFMEGQHKEELAHHIGLSMAIYRVVFNY